MANVQINTCEKYVTSHIHEQILVIDNFCLLRKVSQKTKVGLCLSDPTDTSHTTLREMSNRSASNSLDISDPGDKAKCLSQSSPFNNKSTKVSYDPRNLLAQKSISEGRHLVLNNLKGIFPHNSPSRLKDLLIDWEAYTLRMEDVDKMRMKVRRQFVWQDVLLKLDRIEEGGHSKSVKVQFVGEPSVDQGEPRRELFTLVNQHVGMSLVANGVFRHNVAALENREFLRFGQLTAQGLLQGSPGPKIFSPSVTNYILYGTLEKCTPTIDEMPCGEVKSSMENLATVTDEEEFKEMASFHCSFPFDAGY